LIQLIYLCIFGGFLVTVFEMLIDVLLTDHKHSSSKSKRRVWDGKIRPCAMDME